ncbi:MAG: hypothetical protein V7K77_27445 [Nostoc sp.]|uniref:hypothetical protein n=1 Tax=Nostoc sp. TaxID=1180 RepID=UPI002FF852EB
MRENKVPINRVSTLRLRYLGSARHKSVHRCAQLSTSEGWDTINPQIPYVYACDRRSA